MPRTNLPVLSADRITPLQNPTRSTPDVANGNSFDNSTNRVVMYIINGGAGTTVCTVDIPGVFEGENLPNKIYSIPAGARWVVGPFPSSYSQTDNGLSNRVLFNFDVSTSVTVEIIAVPIPS